MLHLLKNLLFGIEIFAGISPPQAPEPCLIFAGKSLPQAFEPSLIFAGKSPPQAFEPSWVN